jgi:cellulose biosynthesis protein BcsQ
MTMFDGRNNLAKQVSTEINKHFPNKVFETIVPRNVKLSECPSFGKPIILYDIKSTGSEAYLSLAREVILALEGNKDDFNQVDLPMKSNKIPKFEDFASY